MNKYEEAINAIEGECENEMPEQITIDLIQQVCQELVVEPNEDGVTRDLLGSWCYRISILVEVMKPELKTDIALLTKLEGVLENWQADVEFVHKALGGTY